MIILLWYKCKDVNVYRKLEIAMRGNYERFIKVEDINIAERDHLGSVGIDISHFSNCHILPGLTDVHVHLREPGFLYKETMKSGTLSAAAGGFTDIFSMPNLDPCSDSLDNLKVQLDAIKKDAKVHVYPYGAITKGELGSEPADMEQMTEYVIGFTDDGRGVASEQMMKDAMIRAKALGKLIVAHCEDESFPKETSESEWKQLERDIKLIEQTGCSYHVCHVSTKESVDLIRAAKKEGLDITCETAPHYLTISNDEIEDSGRFKMNPPIKSREDKEALLAAIADGTIDMIATDHAPHSIEEKSKGFAGSAFGIVGMETALPVMYSKLVVPGIITMEKLIDLMHENPRKRFGFEATPLREELKKNAPTFSIWDLEHEYVIDPEKFMTKGRSCPFEGWSVKGRCMMTVVDGNIVWKY
jgi:dihydroorotase